MYEDAPLEEEPPQQRASDSQDAGLATLDAATTLDERDDASDAGSRPDAGPRPALPETIVLPDPHGRYVAEVRAYGTGCPRGNWRTALDPDGATFTTVFSAYEVAVDPSRSFAVKDCQLSFDIRASAPISMAVSGVSMRGYALLEPGVNAFMTSYFYSAGMPVVPNRPRTDLTGPFDDWFVTATDVPATEVFWTSCGGDRSVNVVTRAQVRNTTNPRRWGHVNLAAIPNPPASLTLKLAFRACK